MEDSAVSAAPRETNTTAADDSDCRGDGERGMEGRGNKERRDGVIAPLLERGMGNGERLFCEAL